MNALSEIALAPDHSATDAFAHGPFMVKPDGELWVEPPRAPTLSFAWRGHACAARIADGMVWLSADAGMVPYTAERPADRAAVLAAIGSMPEELPEGWRLCLLPDHRLRLEAAQKISAPVTAIGLVSALVGFALALDPYLDRLESAGLASGSVKT
jgi:hypothetical protein